MTASCQAVPAAAADHMTLPANDLAGIEVGHVRTGLDDLADKLMPDGHRHRDRPCRPVVPFVNMEIGAANTGAMDPDEHVIDADGRLGNLFEPKSRFGFALTSAFMRLFFLSVKSNGCTLY